MGKKDTVLKNYLSNPEIFADLMNGFLFHREQVLEKEAMQPMDSSTSVVVKKKDKKAQHVQRYRDVIKKAAVRYADIRGKGETATAVPIQLQD